MELNLTRIEGPAAPSATVVLLRDGAEDLEVFLLRRHGRSQVLGGVFVFPGGKVDPQDVEWADRLDADPATLHEQLGEPELAPQEAAGVFVTAIRELFEEAGLLLADLTPAQARQAWSELRQGQGFDKLLGSRGVRLHASALRPWSRWITPVLSSVGRKRFDTRFFLATVPPGQHPGHDEHEATESVWLTPRAALRRYWEGKIEMAPPQIMSLAHLARHRSVASAFAAAGQRQPPCIRPEPRDVDGLRVLCYPGDPWHSERQQMLPGPTRLTWRNKRFEPDAGLGILVDE
jgi:8-oxo-dGTP pyrophosphatase MutT (NUDIX family)